MDKQNDRIIIRVNGELKSNYIKICNENNMTISSRLKYLIKMDIDGKLKIG